MRRRAPIVGTERPLERGFVLVDVMVAVLLSAVLVGPLTTGALAAWGVAASLREKAVACDGGGEDRGASCAWSWGPTVRAAHWENGPALEVDVGANPDGTSVVGVWADGWVVGELPADAAGHVVVEAQHWRDKAGAELVIRVRNGEAGWGPPWRDVVPDPYGGVSADAVASAAQPEIGAAYDQALSACHGRFASRPDIALSWSQSGVLAKVYGTLFVLPPSTAGVCRLSLEGQSQSWRAERGRWLDVYF